MLNIKKIDAEKQIVFGEVYAPNVVDSQGEMMTADGVETMAHRFLQLQSLKSSIDTQHNNEPVAAYPVESFIVRPNDPDYTEGAWVLGIKIADPELWASVKKGEFNGFSFEAYVSKKEVLAEIEVLQHNVGETAESDGHTHLFFAEVNEAGKVVKGWTDEVNGHRHKIRRGTATEEVNGHKHRFEI